MLIGGRKQEVVIESSLRKQIAVDSYHIYTLRSQIWMLLLLTFSFLAVFRVPERASKMLEVSSNRQPKVTWCWP